MSDVENPFDQEEEITAAQEAELEAEMDAEEADDEPDEIEIAFADAMAEDKTEDEIMLAMIEAGATFKNVRSRYNALMVDAGMLDSRAEKQEIVKSTLEGRDLTTEEGFNGAVDALLDSLKGVNNKSAAASIRQYAKKNELEVYKKPKGEGTGRSGITSQFHDWVVSSLPVSDEDVNAWIEVNGTPNTKRHAKVYIGQAHLANRAYGLAAEKAA